MLALIKDNALLVNTARGAIIDERALAVELRKGRFRAVLDVYETEPLPLDSALRNLDNVILFPHVAGIPAREQMSYAMIAEIERFSKGEPLQYEIPYEKFKLMTKEH
jgi:phosphoglycerate dehydrogenase-like enzyme